MKEMKVVKEFFAHPIIQTALVLAASTLTLSHFSKRVFTEPLRKWELGLPALLVMFFQGFAAHKKSSRFSRPWIGMLIIVLSSIVIVVLNS